MEKAYFQINAAYDWAPGGHLYEKLIRESDGVCAYNILQKTSDFGLHDNELGNNNRKRNRLGGESYSAPYRLYEAWKLLRSIVATLLVQVFWARLLPKPYEHNLEATVDQFQNHRLLVKGL